MPPFPRSTCEQFSVEAIFMLKFSGSEALCNNKKGDHFLIEKVSWCK